MGLGFQVTNFVCGQQLWGQGTMTIDWNQIRVCFTNEQVRNREYGCSQTSYHHNRVLQKAAGAALNKGQQNGKALWQKHTITPRKPN